MQFAFQLSVETSGIVPLNYLFNFSTLDDIDEIRLYEGWLTISQEPLSANTTDFFVAGSIDTDA